MKVAPSNLSRTIALAFPDLKEDLDYWDGLPYLQASEFCSYTEKAIRKRRWSAVRKCLGLAHFILCNADDEVSNIISVSYLEHLDLSGRKGEKAKKMMSAELREAWEDINAYMGEIAGEIAGKEWRQAGKKH